MNYRLSYADMELGSVTQTDSDFPWFYGTFSPSFEKNTTSDRLDHIIEYYRYSIEADNLLQNASEDEWLAFVDAHESQFEDIIDPSYWRLVAPDGETTDILIPVFSPDSEIRWRLA